MNKYQEALDLLKMQLQHTEQNVEAFALLQRLVNHNVLDEYYEINGHDVRTFPKSVPHTMIDDGTVCRNYDEEEE